MKIAVFGGSFDPVHAGHFAVADAVLAQETPDRFLWVPAHQSPHKLDRPPASAESRLALLKTALENRPGEEICRLELDRPPPSFMVDTLEALQGLHPDAKFLLVMGGDCQERFLEWHRVARILEIAEPIFIPRPGFTTLLPGLPGRILPCKPVAASSTALRNKPETK